MIRTQISFEPMEYSLLKVEAQKIGVSIAEFLRRAIRPFLTLEKDQKKWMKYKGLVATGNPKSSVEIDDVIYGQKN